MSIRTAIEIVLEEYPRASLESFRENPAAQFLRDDFPRQISSLIDGDKRYEVEGSAGRGVWTKVPWLAIFDISITTSAQEGYYLVYLFKQDCGGVYLSLNQGVTTVRQQYGAKAKQALLARARDFRARLGSQAIGKMLTKIDLGSNATLARHYEHGNICSKFYDRNELPSEEVLRSDFEQLLALYRRLTVSELKPSGAPLEADENDLGVEQLVELREHKRFERNRTLSRRAKQVHGYVCQACAFDFEKVYGPIGRQFIEAHHLIPLSDLRGRIVQLNAKHDFCVLCSNCHRMIHRSRFISDLTAFRREYCDRRLF